MKNRELNVVTGAFGYTGRYIAQRLLSMEKEVRVLTGHPDRHNPFGGLVAVSPFGFDSPRGMVDALRGATTLYNTYWVRFPRGPLTFDRAVENTRRLIDAARAAGVRKLVHVSITNASEHSSLPYFRGKGLIERAIEQSGLSYAILRPAVIFGKEDILINNLAWILRRFPVFVVPGSGEYGLRPVFVEDLGDAAIESAQKEENIAIDVVGPETYTFNQLVRLLARTVGSKARVIHLSAGLVSLLTSFVGLMVQDVVLTPDEIRGLMANLLASEGPPTGPTRLSEWLERNAGRVGARYASELARHYRAQDSPAWRQQARQHGLAKGARLSRPDQNQPLRGEMDSLPVPQADKSAQPADHPSAASAPRASTGVSNSSSVLKK